MTGNKLSKGSQGGEVERETSREQGRRGGRGNACASREGGAGRESLHLHRLPMIQYNVHQNGFLNYNSN